MKTLGQHVFEEGGLRTRVSIENDDGDLWLLATVETEEIPSGFQGIRIPIRELAPVGQMIVDAAARATWVQPMLPLILAGAD